VKGVHGEKLGNPDLSQQPVLRIKEIPRTGDCEPSNPVVPKVGGTAPWGQ